MNNYPILIQCLNGTITKERLQYLSSNHWKEFVLFARRQGVSGMVYKQLRLIPDVPLDVKDELRRLYFATIWRNTQVYHVLSQIIAILHKNNIRIILLKGTHLADIVYKDIGLRSMSDIDILVQKKDLNATIRCLFQIGFCINKELPDLWIDAEDVPPSYNHYPTLIHQGTNIPVDVHCSIIYQNSPFRVDANELFQRSYRTIVNGQAVEVLHPEDLILHLCIHTAFLNLFSGGIRSLCDISRTIQHYQKDIDWNCLYHRACQWKAKKCFQIAMGFAKEFMGAPVPDDILSEMACYGKWIDYAKNQLWLVAASSLEFLPSRYADFSKPVPLKQKIWSIIHTVFPDKKNMAIMFRIPQNSWRIYFCYPKRVIRYLRKVIYKMIEKQTQIPFVIQEDHTRFKFKGWLAED